MNIKEATIEAAQETSHVFPVNGKNQTGFKSCFNVNLWYAQTINFSSPPHGCSK